MSRSATHCIVSIAHIHVPAERRGTNHETIERLANSIATLGLLSPILVRGNRNQVGEQGERMILVAGQHRLEALKLLVAGRMRNASCWLTMICGLSLPRSTRTCADRNSPPLRWPRRSAGESKFTSRCTPKRRQANHRRTP